MEAGEKTCDGRAADDRVCKHLQLGDFFVGVSGARHLLLQVEHAATLHDDFGEAWATHGDALVPPSIARVSRRDEAQLLWEITFNDGTPKPRQPRSVRVLGVRCVRPLRWPAREREGVASGVPSTTPSVAGLSDSLRATHATSVLQPPALVHPLMVVPWVVPPTWPRPQPPRGAGGQCITQTH